MFKLTIILSAIGFHLNVAQLSNTNIPIVINTWAFENASRKAWETLVSGGTGLDAVQDGCATCEREQCEFTVGYGGSPDENGETALDAMLMDGSTLNVGAVANLRRIKSAAAVARRVLDLTGHSLLVGDLATQFAKSLGFVEEQLYSNHSREVHQSWLNNNCQPNFWMNVKPNPRDSCGPYSPTEKKTTNSFNHGSFGPLNHDTIGMIAIDSFGKIAAGTSSNGATHKIAGRVGDSPIPGAGCYADGEIGAAAATGDGDVMMRLLPSFVAVEEMRRGAHPIKAADTAIRRIADKYPSFVGGIVVLRRDGKYGASCHGMSTFPYCVSSITGGTVIQYVTCK